ncbi:hypothetical protein NQ176_g1401 [Zarea fungicola]|uniref:Uncharacterized protein n=1 Tax=Zarea fungicola TaxID=93591 RepID=A0ACC1NU20_9HYPO|nr:hypothetical protein NQ176_g1401 [Lecanicillium fungicola]
MASHRTSVSDTARSKPSNRRVLLPTSSSLPSFVSGRPVLTQQPLNHHNTFAPLPPSQTLQSHGRLTRVDDQIVSEKGHCTQITLWNPNESDNRPWPSQTMWVDSVTWLLASVTLPTDYAARKAEECPVVTNELINIEARLGLVRHFVHIGDFITLTYELAFKLTRETKTALSEYYKCHLSNNTPHQDFVAAVNKYVYYTSFSIIDEMEPDGGGELPSNESIQVKSELMELLCGYSRVTNIAHKELKHYRN